MCPNCSNTEQVKQHENYKECYMCGWIWDDISPDWEKEAKEKWGC